MVHIIILIHHKRPVWTVGTLARTMWEDSAVFGKPHALEYSAGVDSSFDVVGNTDGATTYYEHETGTDQVQGGTTNCYCCKHRIRRF